MIRRVTLLVTLVLASFLIVSARRFDGDKVLEIIVERSEKWTTYEEILSSFSNQVIQWQRYVGDNLTTIHLQVPSQILDTYTQRLTQAHINYRILIDDVQRLIDAEAASNEVPRQKSLQRKRRQNPTSQLENIISRLIGYYASYDEIADWLLQLQNTFPDIVVLKSIGKTFEGRDILVLKIGRVTPSVVKHAVLVDAGAHAREWIAVSSALYIIHKILSYYSGLSSDNDDDSIYTDIDWYIAPLMNPDGYAFTQNLNGNRLWRKNRSVYPETSFSTRYNVTCHGTDINRNFDFQWNTEIATGTPEPCSEVYVGPTAASENETRAMVAFIVTNNETIRGYTTLHSYSQLFLTRWSYTDAIRTPEFNQTLEVTREASEAINRTGGTNYQYGTATQLLYSFAGGAADWMRAVANIKHSYEVELRDTGELGFLLPTNFIQPVGEEIWAGVQVVALHVLADNPPYTSSTSNPPTSMAQVLQQFDDNAAQSSHRNYNHITYGLLLLLSFIHVNQHVL